MSVHLEVVKGEQLARWGGSYCAGCSQLNHVEELLMREWCSVQRAIYNISSFGHRYG
jgi:hypothetical protein